MNSQTLSKCDRECMLRNAHRLLRAKMRHEPLWSFVSDVTGNGSTSSIAICRELGWNPDARTGDQLPAYM